MNLLSRFFDWIFDADASGDGGEVEAYLSEAVDLNDLEYRMRQLDRRRSIGPFGLNA